MAVTICTSVYYNPVFDKDGNLDDHEGFMQFHDCWVIPTVGSEFICTSTRDDNGNYHNKVMRKFEGIVEKVIYEYDETGHDSLSNRRTMYVEIYVRGKP